MPLNNDYEGGGLFFIPPNSNLGKSVSRADAAKYLKGENVPYKCNTSDYFFPYLPVPRGLNSAAAEMPVCRLVLALYTTKKYGMV